MFSNLCGLCDNHFTAVQRKQLFCSEPHFEECSECGSSFVLTPKQQYSRIQKPDKLSFCSRICFLKNPNRISASQKTQISKCGSLAFNGEKQKETLLQNYGVSNPNQSEFIVEGWVGKRFPHLTNRNEIFDLRTWSQNFQKEYQRLPTVSEGNRYFSLNHLEKRVRQQKAEDCFIFGSSTFENIVCSLLESFGFLEEEDFLRRKRFLRDSEGRLKELDIYLPKLSLAFEIQDFATHSRDSDQELGKFNGAHILKRGPKEHENKRQIAKRQGIQLIDLWESDILNVDFSSKLQKLVRR